MARPCRRPLPLCWDQFRTDREGRESPADTGWLADGKVTAVNTRTSISITIGHDAVCNCRRLPVEENELIAEAKLFHKMLRLNGGKTMLTNNPYALAASCPPR